MREYYSLLAGISCQLVSLAQVGISTQIEETGTTFEQNAILKANGYQSISGLMSLADDSGLEVDALGGQPGVLSARYAGEDASDTERLDYLLSKLKDVPWEKRTARFRCVIAIALPDGKIELCDGACEGLITFEPKGTSGFGYDPVFYVPNFDKTMAELTSEEKNSISHRGQAAQKARDVLMNLCQ